MRTPRMNTPETFSRRAHRGSCASLRIMGRVLRPTLIAPRTTQGFSAHVQPHATHDRECTAAYTSNAFADPRSDHVFAMESERVKSVARNRVLLITLGILTTLTLLYLTTAGIRGLSSLASFLNVSGSYGSPSASSTKPFELEGVTLGRPFSILLLAGNATESAELLTKALIN